MGTSDAEAETMTLTLRPEVQEFAQAMEAVLRQNDRKGKAGWQDMDLKECLDRAYDEMHELWQAIGVVERDANRKNVQHEAVDAANFLMFLWHRAPSIAGGG